jgi:DNA-binding transcriptional LysR family regulator
MALNLHLLRLFAAVAEHGGFSRAAAALHLSQPAVSKGIREFEAQVGATLLDRGAGGVRPTEVGRRLLVQAHALFAAERAAEEELLAFRGLQRGTLSIGASTTIATYLLPPLLGAFNRAHPAVELRLTSANTRRVAELLLARELDIALVEGPTHEFNLVAHPWRQEEMALIAAPKHRLTKVPADVVLHALRDEIFLIREPGSGTREVVAAALASRGIQPRSLIEIGSTEAIKQMVAAGFGVAIVSAAAAADQIALGRVAVLRPARFSLYRPLFRLSLPGRLLSAVAIAFSRLLDTENENMAPAKPRKRRRG